MTLEAREETSSAAPSDRPDGEDRRWVLFRSVAVFDRRQVAPMEGVAQAPLEPPSEPLTGDSHRHLLERLQAFAATIGFSIAFEAEHRARAAD